MRLEFDDAPFAGGEGPQSVQFVTDLRPALDSSALGYELSYRKIAGYDHIQSLLEKQADRAGALFIIYCMIMLENSVWD